MSRSITRRDKDSRYLFYLFSFWVREHGDLSALSVRCFFNVYEKKLRNAKFLLVYIFESVLFKMTIVSDFCFVVHHIVYLIVVVTLSVIGSLFNISFIRFGY